MPFSDAQIACAIELDLGRTTAWDAPRVKSIARQEASFYGLSANTFERCRATVLSGGQERTIALLIKRWASGGPTDVDMGLDPWPRESLAFAAGILAPDALPPRLEVPILASLDDPDANEHCLILRDVSAELTAFRSPLDLAEIHRRYAVALDQLACMHAAWEKPGPQARLKALPWLVPDRVRLCRGQAVTRHVEGLPISTEEAARLEGVRGWIQGARIQAAREAFYTTLSAADRAMWKRHECDRSALIAACADLPTTLVHGDFWPLNLGLRVVDGQETVILIDWEWIGNGCAALDVAKLLSVGAPPEQADFDGQGLAVHYLQRYLAHGGTRFDASTWRRAYELAEVYHALIVHPLAAGSAILDGSPARSCLDARTPRLAELIARRLG